ncbi:hypothetical protein DFH01_26980 [Falsiroseomonas bella]|uniref:Tripartite tricarboxylate transporter TctB family protein n=1 Tax=Falsiroseomonas bella TaxID=2184016 RepID=A0A317F546_9PROT|nr:tripartite tricarboxylate transporter TctB family protein [Falsiroseomonas bella]PWS33985.1 hypothetical protein DFH01_26980 [Falsiroseomonas bella]
MRLNTKNLISGGIFILVAVIGLWLNTDHTLGSARRMGPGYMPMLSFGLLGVLGAIVFLGGLFNGPDPLARWTRLEVMAVPLGIVAFFAGYFIADATGLFTGWYPLGWGAFAGCLALSVAPGWRPIGLVHAGLAVFGLMLEQFGLIASITTMCIVAAFADPTHRVKGVIGMIIFLCVLCWLVFIYELDIRVPVWPVFLTQ